MKIRLVILALLTASIFVMNAAVLFGGEPLPTKKGLKPEPAVADPADGNVRSMAIPLLSTGGGEPGCCPKMTYISTRTSHTLHNFNNFVSRDCDLTWINPYFGWAMIVLPGNRFNFLSLDAADLVFEEIALDVPVPPQQPKLLFSVRESQSLTNSDGTTFYAKQQDVCCLVPQPCANLPGPGIYHGYFEVLFDGSHHNCPGVDGVAMYKDGCILLSPTEDWYCDVGCNPPDFFTDHDIVKYDPCNDTVELFLRGSAMGVCSVDGFDYFCCEYEGGGDSQPTVERKIYFSVRNPEYVLQPGDPIYLEDGDIACYDLDTGHLSVYLRGNDHYIYDIDAVVVNLFQMPPRAFQGGGGPGREDPNTTLNAPKSIQ